MGRLAPARGPVRWIEGEDPAGLPVAPARSGLPAAAAALALAVVLLTGCDRPTSTDLRPERPVHPALSVLSPPSGYTIVDLTPSLPDGQDGRGDLINDAGQVVFHITDLTTFSPTYFLWEEGETSSYGTDVRVFEINNAGQAVGWNDGNDVPEATLWNGTVPTPLAGRGSRAFDITEGGIVTGEDGQGFLTRPFIWRDGSLTPLGIPPGAVGAAGRDVNESGRVIGPLIQEIDPFIEFGFLWADGRFTRITPPSAEFSGVRMRSSPGDDNLNAAGDFVGLLTMPSRGGRGFFWSDGVMTVLPTLGGDVSFANELNQTSQVVGSAETADGFMRAFVWEAGTTTVLGTLGGTSSRGFLINDRGQVAGTATTADGDRHAFVWSEGAMTDLGTLGGPGSFPTDMNEFGEVVGWAEDADGVRHAVLWRLSTPTEEIGEIEELLEDLVAGEVLTREQVEGLSAKLTAIVSKIESGRARPAVNQLGAFVHQVEAFVNDGSLSEEDGQILVTAARAIMDDLGG